MKKILAIIIIFICMFSYKCFSSVESLKDIKRNIKSQQSIANGNYDFIFKDISKKSFRNKHLENMTFSFANMTNMDLRGTIFVNCDFSHAIGLDTAIYNKNSSFESCNLINADLPEKKYLKNCKIRRYSNIEKRRLLKAIKKEGNDIR